MAERDIVVIGASAGGVEAVAALVEGLPADFGAAVFVVVHFPPHGTSVLPRILTRRGALRAVHPEDGAPFERGCVYVAPPDRHLMLERGRIRVVRGPRENAARPAVDPLFRSAARAYGPRVVGVVLTGNLDDGTAGLMAVRTGGGVTVVQDPDDARYPGMPTSAIQNVDVDHVVPLAAMAPLLIDLVGRRIQEPGGGTVPGEESREVAIAAMEPHALHAPERPGTPSGYVCPECSGVLWEIEDGGLPRFRCRVGHGYSIETLLAEQGEALEAALWAAFRALEERAALTGRMAERMEERAQPAIAGRYREQEREVRRSAELIRRLLVSASEPLPMVGAAGTGHVVA